MSGKQIVVYQPKRGNQAKKQYNGPKNKVGQYFYKNYKKPYQYPGVGAKYGGKIGKEVGSMVPVIGSVGGKAIGRAIGASAHSLMKTVTGFGDYTVSKNSLLYNQDAVPQFHNSKRCTILTHREFITDIRGSTGFNLQQFTINPGNAQTFPWLSQIATNYEEYVVQGLLFEFKTTSAMAVSSTNTALGTVVLATQYNSLDAAFINKQQMENYEYAQSTVACESVIHPVECDPQLTANQGLFYINNASATAVGDPRLYNIGNFSIATVGMQAAATIGELWVTYKICLLKPRLSGSISGSDHWILDAVNMNASNPYGLLPVLSTSSTSYNVPTPSQALTSLINCPWQSGLVNNTACYINPSFVGNLLVVWQAHGGTNGQQDPGVSVAGNVTIISIPALIAGFVTYVKTSSLSGTLGSGDSLYSFVIKCNGGYGVTAGVPPSFTLTGAVLPSAPASGNLAVYSIPTNITN